MRGGTTMNYFIEGIQGTGKTSMLEKLAKGNPAMNVFREGDLFWGDLKNGMEIIKFLNVLFFKI